MRQTRPDSGLGLSHLSEKSIQTLLSCCLLARQRLPLNLQLYQATPKVIKKLTRNLSDADGLIQPVLRRRGGNLQPGTQPAQGAVWADFNFGPLHLNHKPSPSSHTLYSSNGFKKSTPRQKVNLLFQLVIGVAVSLGSGPGAGPTWSHIMY